MLDLRSLMRTSQVNVSTRAPRGQIITMREAIKRRLSMRGDVSAVDTTWLKLQLTALLDGKPSMLGPFDGVDGAWAGQPCFVVGSSTGLKNAMDAGFELSMLDGFHSIGVNHVIDAYIRFEWHLFIDKRFLSICPPATLRAYRGRLFAHVRTGETPSERTTVFYTQHDGPSERIIDGLFTTFSAGLVAMNLALVSGADPIYLMGLDNGGKAGAHYSSKYTGAQDGVNDRARKKYTGRFVEYCLRYAPWASRLKNVDPLGDITMFEKVDVRDVPELQGRMKK